MGHRCVRAAATATVLLLAACSTQIPPAATAPPSATPPVRTAPPAQSPTPLPPDRLAGVQIAARYAGTPPDLSGYDPASLRTIVVTGDVIPARMVNHAALRSGDFAWPWEATASLLRDADITYINLEASLTPSCPDLTAGFTLCGSVRFVGPVTAAGTNLVVNIANNHMANLGSAAVDDTVRRLEARGALPSGLGHIAVRTIRGVRFGFVGFNAVGASLDRAALRAAITTARGESDVVIVQLHMGREYVTSPLPAPGIAPDDPRDLAHLAIDDGADLVIGNHPHCVQGGEFYHGHYIAYAHGNFVFDQDWSVGTQEGAIGHYVFAGTTLVAVWYTPLRIGNNGQPVPLDGTTGEGRRILDRMARSSHELLGEARPILPVAADGSDSCP